MATVLQPRLPLFVFRGVHEQHTGLLTQHCGGRPSVEAGRQRCEPLCPSHWRVGQRQANGCSPGGGGVKWFSGPDSLSPPAVWATRVPVVVLYTSDGRKASSQAVDMYAVVLLATAAGAETAGQCRRQVRATGGL